MTLLCADCRENYNPFESCEDAYLGGSQKEFLAGLCGIEHNYKETFYEVDPNQGKGRLPIQFASFSSGLDNRSLFQYWQILVTT